MSNELVRAGRRMDEALAKLREDRGGSLDYWKILEAEMRRCPSPAASSVPAAPPVFLEWGFCAVHDRGFYTRIERQSSGLYLRVGCFRDEGGGNYAGMGDSRVLRLDQIRGHLGPCPWCGDDRGQFECDCGIVCGGAGRSTAQVVPLPQ